MAIDDYKIALLISNEIDSNNTLMDLGDCFEVLNQYDSAIFYYSMALERAPTQNLFNRRGIVYGENEQFELAIQDFSESIRLGGNWYNNRAQTYLKMGLFREALEDANKDVELHAKSEWAYGNRAHILFEMNRFNDAIDDYFRALEFNDSDYILLGIGKCYIKLDSLDQGKYYLKLAADSGSEEAQSELEKIKE